MPRDGSIILTDVREPTLTIVCAPCDRRGRYSVAKLMAEHGDSKRSIADLGVDSAHWRIIPLWRRSHSPRSEPPPLRARPLFRQRRQPLGEGRKNSAMALSALAFASLSAGAALDTAPAPSWLSPGRGRRPGQGPSPALPPAPLPRSAAHGSVWRREADRSASDVG
jgi:hypothetical protein